MQAMSAQRRTGSKTQSGAATVAPRPSAPPPSAPQTPSRPAKTTGDKAKGAPAARPSAFSARIEGIRRIARDTYSEAKKVNWPDRETTRNLTFVVIGISVVLGLLLGGIDYVLVKLLDVF
jgi:preprotein translocase subunit SecE